MSASLILMLAITAPGGEPVHLETVAQVRDAYRTGIQETAHINNRELPIGVQKLAAVYRELKQTDLRISRAELSRMQRVIEKRLEDVAQKLSLLQNRKSNSRQDLQGGTAASDMQWLIDLIQNTIETDSWEFGGGALGQFPGAGGGIGAGAGGSNNANNLIDLIKENTSPYSWDILGGPGTISAFAF